MPTVPRASGSSRRHRVPILDPVARPQTTRRSNRRTAGPPLPCANLTDPRPMTAGPPDGMQTFFQSKPPQVEKALGHNMSTVTRETNFFDMHLHPDLRLKRVVFLDDLPETLSNFCDKLSQNPSELPRAAPGTFDVDYPMNEGIIDEKTLQDHWLTVSKCYCPVASGLCFKDSWEPHFQINVVAAGPRKDFGVADGYLSPRDPESLSKEQRKDLDLLKKHGLSNFLIWEFKSLASGPHILQNLRELVDEDFTWTGCQERSVNDEPSVGCGQAHRVGGRLSVTGRRTGPDSTAIDDLIRPPVDSDAQEVHAGQKRPLSDTHDTECRKRQKVSVDITNKATVYADQKAFDRQDALRVIQQVITVG
ncbi:hypothetical protein GALMADRAFT_1205041 [Galerina marginata CBS 339.88]|uniref:Uncharacterized protein n=1 Tax=Galerina marginata (strain CBS 339.88) TaxID=685588 RepID=A0A067SHE5_GALM3|nr:hypothetical protein GALMADRAFT_1205041 [Galerina marginata CBS 339.88]